MRRPQVVSTAGAGDLLGGMAQRGAADERDTVRKPGSMRTRHSPWPGSSRHRGDEAQALYQLGAVHAHAAPPDVAQAEAPYQQALALAEELGMRPLQAHCHHGLGTLYLATG